MSIDLKIRKTLGSFTLDVEFSAGNEVLALLGASGCGKSMTLRCIAGIEKPDEGYIIVDGVTLFDSKKRINLPPQKRHVGMLFQNYALFPNMTVEQNIMTGLKREKDKAVRRRKVAESIEKFHLQGLEKNLPHQLSGGQQQRVALARILVGEPSILMLDEPFSALDSHLRWTLEQELSDRLKDFPGTTLFVSHSREEVYRISDRIAVYNNGRIEVLDDKGAVFENPRTWQAALLTGCRNLSDITREGGKLCAESWKLDFEVEDDGESSCVGIRTNLLEKAEGPGRNTFLFETESEVPDSFHVVRIIRRKDNPDAQPFLWEMPQAKAKTIPFEGYVHFPDESIMLLKK